MKFKLLSIVFVSCLALLCKRDISDACGTDAPAVVTYNLFDPHTINPVGYEAMYFTFHSYFYSEQDLDSIGRFDNVREWSDSLNIGDLISNSLKGREFSNQEDSIFQFYWANEQCERAISSIVYNSTFPDINELKKYSLGHKHRAFGGDIVYGFLNYVNIKRAPAIFDYVQFAKECDTTLNGNNLTTLNSYYVIVNEWFSDSAPQDEMQVRNADSLKKLDKINKGLNILKTVKSIPDFLKYRYAYQIVRLAHYNNMNKECVQYFDELFPNEDKGGLMYYWALGHKAGALQKLARVSEGNYCYLKQFANCRDRRTSAFRSLTITDQNMWDSVYKMCKNVREKTTLYAFRGINFQNDGTVEMNEIRKLDPNSDFMEMLAAREIVKLENLLLNCDLVPIAKYDDSKYGINVKYTETNLERLKNIISAQINDPTVAKKSLWKIADAYLDFLKADFKTARRKIAMLVGAADLTPDQSKQIAALDCVLTIADADKITPELEDDIYSKLYDFNPKFSLAEIEAWSPVDEINHTLYYVLDNMSYKYFKQGDSAKALLCSSSLFSLNQIESPGIVKDIIAMIEKPNKTNFEEHILDRFHNEAKDLKSELYEIAGTGYLREHKYQAAIDCFSKMKPLYTKLSADYNFQADPFEMYYISSFKAIQAKKSKDKYNKLTFARKLLELENSFIIEKDPEITAINKFKLANALYNTSYWGACRSSLDYYSSNIIHSNYIDKDEKKGVDEDIHVKKNKLRDKAYTKFVSLQTDYYLIDYSYVYDDYSTDLTEKYYRYTLDNTKDRELQAKCLFALAKCEQNKFYINDKLGLEVYDYFEPDQRDNFLKTKSKYRTDFNKLIASYQDTKSFAEAQSNCVYFSKYIARKK